ncbi:MAG: DUF4402 domain-containing protein [Methanomicrobia archaeon]|nr:DUF4402 domain-containing protein [Methanomicrobia archaeon]
MVSTKGQIIFLVSLAAIALFCLLVGFEVISPLRWLYKKRRSCKFLGFKVGILNDIREEEKYGSVPPKEWKKEIEKVAKTAGVKIKVDLIKTNKNFGTYAAIINPYGGTYPESDLKSFDTLTEIFNYVYTGGLFVSVEDIFGYYAYNASLKPGRKIETPPPVYGIKYASDGRIERLEPARPFERTPAMEKLGLRVISTEYSLNWNNISALEREKLLLLLSNIYNIPWVKNATVSMNDGGNTCLISNEEDGNFAKIILNPTNGKVTLNTSGGRSYNLRAKKENDNPYLHIIDIWDVEFADKFSEVRTEMFGVKVFRAVIVEKNVKSVVKPEKWQIGKEITPLCFVNYGNEGKFLFSLLRISDQEEIVKEQLKTALSELVVNFVKDAKLD